MKTDPPPRILFHAVPDDLVSEFNGLPGTAEFVDDLGDVHITDFDLLVTFDEEPENIDGVHVLGFGLEYAAGQPFAVRADTEVRARHAYVAANETASRLSRLIERTILNEDSGPPRLVWRAYVAVRMTGDDTNDLLGSVTPLVHVGRERFVYAHVATTRKGYRVWALPWETSGHRSWLDAVLRELHELDSGAFPMEGLAEWRDAPEWATPELVEAKRSLSDAIDEAETQRQEAARRLVALQRVVDDARDAADAGPRRVLTSDGDELVEVVSDLLRAIGFEVSEVDDQNQSQKGRRLEDLRVVDPGVPGWEALAEVKGYSKGAKVGDVHQIAIHPVANFAADNGRPPRTVWHVVNAWRTTHPSLRETAIPRDLDLAPLTAVPGALIDTRDLFRAWRDVARGAVPATEVRASLRDAVTRWTWDLTEGSESQHRQT